MIVKLFDRAAYRVVIGVVAMCGCSKSAASHTAAMEGGSSAPPAAAQTTTTTMGSGAGAGAVAAPTSPDAGSPHSGSAGTTGIASAAGSGGAGPGATNDEDAGAKDSTSATNNGLPRDMQAIDPPVPDDCIKDVSAGDHTFSCGGLTFLVMVGETCTQYACGLIFDIHGATMSGAQMRDNTLLYKIAPSKGYIVVNPSATASNTGGTWDLTNDPPTVADFMDRTIKAFHIDPKRIHVGGFSQGSIMTFWFLCNHNQMIASAAPVSGATSVDCLNDSWPRIPIFYENGTKDQASMIDSARMMVDKIVSQLKLTGGDQIAGDGHYMRKHWQGDQGMVFDYIEHDYGGQAVLDGHCIPGGVDTPTMGKNNFGLNATTCTTGDITINWGELALQWYLDHPKP